MTENIIKKIQKTQQKTKKIGKTRKSFFLNKWNEKRTENSEKTPENKKIWEFRILIQKIQKIN